MTILNVKMWANEIGDPATTPVTLYWFLNYQAVDYYQMPTTPQIIIQIGTTQNASATPYPIFTNPMDALNYYKNVQAQLLVDTINTALSSTIFTGYDVELTDPPVTMLFNELAPVAFSGVYSDLTSKPTLSTVATSGAYADLSGKPTIPAAQIQSDWNQTTTSALDYIKNKPSIVSPTYTNPTRSLNTAFQISSTQAATVVYSVDIACTMSLTAGASGTAVLEYADDSGFTTNVKTVSRVTNSNSGTLTIGLALTQIGGAPLSGRIPAAKYVRIRTINNTATPTFTLQNTQEVLL